MASNEIWTESELDAIVANYFAMLRIETLNQPLNKALHNRSLREHVARTKGSIEFKHRNISAVLEVLGMPWLAGYRPAENYQAALVRAVERYLSDQEMQVRAVIDIVPAAHAGLRLVDVPPLRGTLPPEALESLVRQFDPVERDRLNRELGEAGERLVLEHERVRLSVAGRDDLAQQVEWSSKVRGDGLGYDVLSFTKDGAARHLEVKTTRGAARTPFFMTRNEMKVADDLRESYCLCRVYAFGRPDQAMFQVPAPLTEHLYARPETWRMTLNG